MRFLVDNQLPPSLARWLRDRGHDADHVFESGLHLPDDRDLWTRTLADARIVVSKDEDFLYLSSKPGAAGRFLWVRLGNCKHDALLAAFSRSLDTIVAAFESQRPHSPDVPWLAWSSALSADLFRRSGPDLRGTACQSATGR